MQRLKVLCILLLIVFFGSIYQSALLPFIEGVEYGLTVARFQMDNNTNTEDFVMMDVTPKDDLFPDKAEMNLKTGQPVMVRLNNVTVMVASTMQKPLWWKVLQSFNMLLSLATLILGIIVPFLVVQIFRSMQFIRVFDVDNISRINKIGYILLFIGILETIIQGIKIFSARSLVDFMHYSFSYGKMIDFSPILMGIVVLIMNEILRIGLKIKEENDLTI